MPPVKRRLVIFLALFASFVLSACSKSPDASFASHIPSYRVDPFWPKPLPNNWLVGQVAGISVDSKGHIWIIQRPDSLDPDEHALTLTPPTSLCCHPAPPVMQFDTEGNLLQAWGGPNQQYPWPSREHGITIDYQNNVWIAGGDHHVLKFKADGTFLLQIGRAGETAGNSSTELLGAPAEVVVDPATDEVFIADGYGNRRVIVYDANTGEYKRHWGAYGSVPDDVPLAAYNPQLPPAKHFKTNAATASVHCVALSNDGYLYVCDRTNNRFQVFKPNGEFIAEGFIAPDTLANGTVWDIDFSHDSAQTYLYIADGTNQRVWILERASLKIVGHFGRSGHYAGEFHWLHNLVVDAKGSIYTTEVQHGKRFQKFNLEK